MVGESDIMVSIQHLSKSFGETEVLRDVNVDVKRGEVVVVLGPSGSGKSTMLRCINLLEKPTGGHIFIEGQEITAPGTDVDKLREHVGMVFQQFNLFPHLSAKKNVMLAQRKRRLPSGSTFRWPAAACRDCTCSRHGSACHAVRRGHLSARPRARARRS